MEIVIHSSAFILANFQEKYKNILEPNNAFNTVKKKIFHEMKSAEFTNPAIKNALAISKKKSDNNPKNLLSNIVAMLIEIILCERKNNVKKL